MARVARLRPLRPHATKAFLQGNCVVSEPGHPRYPSADGTRDSQDRPHHRRTISGDGHLSSAPARQRVGPSKCRCWVLNFSSHRGWLSAASHQSGQLVSAVQRPRLQPRRLIIAPAAVAASRCQARPLLPSVAAPEWQVSYGQHPGANDFHNAQGLDRAGHFPSVANQ